MLDHVGKTMSQLWDTRLVGLCEKAIAWRESADTLNLLSVLVGQGFMFEW